MLKKARAFVKATVKCSSSVREACKTRYVCTKCGSVCESTRRILTVERYIPAHADNPTKITAAGLGTWKCRCCGNAKVRCESAAACLSEMN